MSSEIPATDLNVGQGKPMISVNRRSAKRCWRTTDSSRAPALGCQAEGPALDGQVAVGPQPPHHVLRDRRGGVADAFGQGPG